MKRLLILLLVLCYAGPAWAQVDDHDHEHEHEHDEAGGPPPGPPPPNLPPPGPEELAALTKIDGIKSKHPTNEAEARTLSAQYEEALTAYINGFPESPRAGLALEAALKNDIAAGDPGKAEKLARAFIDHAKSPEAKSQGQRELLQVYKFGGQPDRAIAFALEQANKEPDRPDSEFFVYEAATIQADRGLHDKGVEILETYIKDHPKHPALNKLKLRVADFLVSAGRAREALPRLDAIEKASQNAEEKVLATYFTGVALLAASRQATGDEAALLRKQALAVLAPLVDETRKNAKANRPYGGMAFTTIADVALAAGDVKQAGRIYEEMAKLFAGEAEEKYATKSLADLMFIGLPLTDLEGPELGSGKPVKSTDFHGKILLVDFFTLGYPEYPNTAAAEKRLAKKLAGQPFAMLGVSLNGKEYKDQVKQAVEVLNLDWPVIFDGSGVGGAMATSHHITAMPANFLVDENGIVLRVNLFGPHLDDMCTQEAARVAKGLPSVYRKPAAGGGK